MHRKVRNALIAICCTGLMAGFGCSSTGEMSVNGFYQSRVGGLSGDECDEILMQAADAEGDVREEMKDEFRECVEDSIADQGGHAQCRDDEDPTCDLILEEVADAIDAVREERGNEQPNCDAPQSNGDAALCHLMEAYEVCQLDHDGDGEPDVDRLPPDACEDLARQAEGDADAADILDDHPECRDGNQGGEDETNDDDRPNEDGDEADDPNDHPDEGQDGDRVDEKSCDEIHAIADQAGEQDREWLMRERPECFDGADEPNADGEPADETNTNPDDQPDGNTEPADQFCQELEEEIATCDNDDRLADLQETYERECVE